MELHVLCATSLNMNKEQCWCILWNAVTINTKFDSLNIYVYM